ncbi:MAG TPA: helix-turn-helix transcriptional regulator [Pyrinomonadaceae bacterium]|jgi:AraC-like DNA-binding protein|nr:helix-turn-helix transcriptional regulator [Pyrinomonadaceae bacterium]
MKEDLSRKLMPGELARAVNLSPAHLRYLFKAETGMSVMQYQKTLRMEEARRLLENTFLSGKEIMLRIGITDESHFVRDFKQSYGMTPAQYRARFRPQKPE